MYCQLHLVMGQYTSGIYDVREFNRRQVQLGINQRQVSLEVIPSHEDEKRGK